MSTRRSRLSIKPNLGPKVGPGTKTTTTGPKSGGKGPVSSLKQKETSVENVEKKGKAVPQLEEGETKVESPKKELRKLLMKRVASGDEENDSTVIQHDVNEENANFPTEAGQDIESDLSRDHPMAPASQTFSQSTFNTVAHDRDQAQDTSHKTTEDIQPVQETKLKQDTEESIKGQENVMGQETNKSPVRGAQKSNKGNVVMRNRFPKAKPNLTDAGRPKRAPVTQSSLPASPLKSPRPVICQSPAKSLSGSSEKTMVVARNLQFHNPSDSNHCLEDSSGEAQKGEKRHQTNNEAPQGERRLRHQSASESQMQGEKRQRHTSISEVIPAKRKKPPKVNVPNDKPADKTKLKMRDLIYWNPVNNPMKNSGGQQKKPKPATDRISIIEESAASLTTPTQKGTAVDDPEPMDADEAMPVPQVKIGPDGNIILNEESLVIKNDKVIEEQDGDAIDETDSNVTYTSFRQKRSKKSWSEKETAKFYKALSCMGTDFSLILKVFPNKSRDDIKKKFSMEDRKNRMKVEDALRNKIPFDLTAFENDDTDTCTEVVKTKKPRKKKEAPAKPKTVKTRARPQEWKKYYENTQTDEEENKEERIEYRRWQVEQARKRLAERSSQSMEKEGVPFIPPSVQASEDPKEVVEILMSMSEGKNSAVEPAQQQKQTSSLNPFTTADQLTQMLEQSHQTALLGDENNGPFILVYSPPQDAAGETVIHVYRIQREEVQDIIERPSIQEDSGALDSVTSSVPSTSNQSHVSTSQNIISKQNCASVSQRVNIAPENVFTPVQAPIIGSANAVIQSGNVTAVTYSRTESDTVSTKQETNFPHQSSTNQVLPEGNIGVETENMARLNTGKVGVSDCAVLPHDRVITINASTS